ncbi:hypothetical protein C8J23_12019 [Shewanella chilikensis]|uniref:Uncharacterized protein n=1 Tax=Shewanella chilikensis TaxID=558541 RepID=A0ABX5PLV5_9GAMM|nr:hypothetical protein [Shewanella chilikensis]MCL1152585.1 hypothetical protein [Shewanella chilikensis]PYE57569.1 hypothetical protein C8J23_12019 [Shewanella chilikensis]GGZ46364.1 hypothetical protein GCM10007105_35830 [Shewanella chilikensis]
MSQEKSADTLYDTFKAFAEKYQLEDPPEILRWWSNIEDEGVGNEAVAQLKSIIERMMQPPELSSPIPEGTSEENAAEVLAKIPGSLQAIVDDQLDIAGQYTALFNLVPDEVSDTSLEEIRNFANAEPAKAFEAFDAEGLAPVAALKDMPEELAEFVQANIALHMAGLTKAASLLQKLFVERTYVTHNQGFQELITDMTKHLGAAEVSGTHAKKGVENRHAKNRQRKDYAISLYRKKPYQNPSQARTLHYPAIEAYANSIDHPFSSEYQGMQTVYKWFLEAERIKGR